MDAIPTTAQQLAPASITVARLRNSIFIFILFAVSATGFWKLTPAPFTWFLLSFTLLSIPILLWVPAIQYRRTYYWLNENGLYIQRGIWWQSRTLVPRNRIQHTDVTQGPLQRKYQLGTLVVHTAGATNASVALPGVLHSDAEALRKRISESAAESSDAI